MLAITRGSSTNPYCVNLKENVPNLVWQQEELAQIEPLLLSKYLYTIDLINFFTLAYPLQFPV